MSVLRKLGLAPVPGAAVVDEMSLEVVAELDKVGGWRGDVAADSSGVWFSTWDDKAVSRVDPRTREETLRATLPEKPLHLAADEYGAVVVCEKDVVVRVGGDGRVRAQVELPDAGGVVASGGAVWVECAAGGAAGGQFAVSLVQLDSGTLAPRREVPMGRSRFAGGMRTGDGVVSTLVEDPPGSMREVVLHSTTGEPLPDERAPKARGIAERDGVRWLKDGDRGFKRVVIDGGRTVATGKVPGPKLGSVVLAHGHLWACNFRRQRPGHREI